MSLETAKILGILGVVIEIIGGFVGGYGSLVGLILILIAVYMVSKEVNRPDIFNNYILAFVTAIVGLIIIFIAILGTLMAMFGGMGFGPHGAGEIHPTSGLLAAIGAIILWLIVAWIILVVSAYFIKKSYTGIAEELNHGTFRLAGKLYFWGAILLIILVGAILLIVGVIVELIAWATMPTQKPSKAPETAPPSSPEGGMGEPVI